MKKKVMRIFVLSFIFIVPFSMAQKKESPVLLTIGNEKITLAEFEAVYKKNNLKTEIVDKKSLEEYLELFINFKLKVKEAVEEGLDTMQSFINELSGYRKQLAQPYLSDKEVTEKLIQEAYERMKTDIRASHILIKLSENALPKDTLEAYNKIMKIRQRLMKGEDFGKVARETSEDLSAKDQPPAGDKPGMKGNSGDVGYFSAMQMVYPFESAAYNLKPGDISNPVKTRFGYHLIKVTDRRPAQGQIQVAHIMLRTPFGYSNDDSLKIKAKIDEIYYQLKNGGDFNQLASQYSEDKGTSSKGGVLPWFGAGRMVPEFENAAFALKKNGDFSAPVKSMYGWHIIKRIDHKGVPSFEEAKSDLKMKISKDQRSQLSRSAIINRIKKENTFKETPKNQNLILPALDSGIFKGKWSAEKTSKMTQELFKLGNKSYSVHDFALYIEKHQASRSVIPFENLIGSMYKNFVDETCISLEDGKLEGKYPEFKALLSEYRDGILLFELTDRKVWSKALKDTIGLQNFYEANKQNYNWDSRIEGTVYSCKNNDVATKVRAMIAEGKSDSDILSEVNKDSQLSLKVESGKYQKSDNKVVEKIEWKTGISGNVELDNQICFVVVKSIIQPQPKTISEAKGIITADYQNKLEKEWIEVLRKKYTVQVNKEMLSQIK